MGNFSWTNFKPFVIIYVIICLLAYLLSPGHYKKENLNSVKPSDWVLMYRLYFNEEYKELNAAFNKMQEGDTHVKLSEATITWEEQYEN